MSEKIINFSEKKEESEKLSAKKALAKKIGAISLAIALFGAGGGAMYLDGQSQTPYFSSTEHEVTVEPGDTLVEIAEENIDGVEKLPDIGIAVKQIETDNNINTNIQPGQKIEVRDGVGIGQAPTESTES